ncbi:MAG: hypothetical protein QOE06_2234 [Thermoleophilaceae bacterium]|nr:hypothetical protein [Thermoleophilaceae bacterium]
MQGLLSGERLGNYRLGSVLGRGGMGVVYRAEQISLGRSVAVKVIAPELSGDPLLRERFKQEARLAASLDHPNVLPIYEADEADGLLYIAMRYVEGVDLGETIRRQGRLPTHHAAGIVMQIAQALDAAHSNGLVHRDVKPANVLLAGTVTEVAYLTDFGLTKHVEAISGPTLSGQFVGTPDYAAPEQIQGRAVTAATDIYALGCVLHEALTGVVPFPRDSNLAKMWAHANDPPPRPSDVAEKVSSDFDDIVGRALSKEPAARYPSAGDLGRAALAAAADARAPLTEHSVAVGAASVVGTDRESPRRLVRRDEALPTAQSVPSANPPDRPTAALDVPPPPAVRIHRPAMRRPRQRLLVGATLLAVALLAGGGVVAVALRDGRTQAPQPTAKAGVGARPSTATTDTKPTTAGPGSTDAGGRLPPVSNAVMATQVTSLLRGFYQAQIAGDYTAQRQLTTRRYQRKVIDRLGFSRWVANQLFGTRHFTGAQNIDATIVDTDPADGSATVSMRGLSLDPHTKCSTWEGITWARFEGGSWRYDPSVKATPTRELQWSQRSGEVLGAGCFG